MDGNNSSSFLCKCQDLAHCSWFPSALHPVLGCLQQLKMVKDKTFSWDLLDGWEEDLDSYKRMFTELQVYSHDILEVNLSCTWKIHIIAAHLKPFLQKDGCGLACFAEQTW